MTLFTKMRSVPVAFHESDAWLSPSLGAYLSAAGTDAWRDSPVPSMDDMAKLHALQTEAHGIEYDDDGMSAAYSFGASDYLSVEDQTRRITDAGLEGHLKPQQGYSAAMLDVIIDRKRGELERAATREAAPAAWAPLGLAAGLGVSLLDPLNVASAFVPVIGEQRALALLGKAGSAWGRAGARAGIGAVEGAAGAAMVEPIIAAARTQEQAEYGMFDALGNIAFGAVFGAALHPAAGAVGDWLRGRRGQRHPWEFSSPTPDTLVLKDAHAQAIYEARLVAEPGMDTARLTQEAHAAAALFDARARAWAHDTGRTPEEYYEAYRPQYQAADTRAGFEGPDNDFLLRAGRDDALFQSEVESDAFKQWFGNSKVVDENGAPLAVYHGTGATIGDDFSFDYGFVGKNGSAEGYGFYFTSDKSVADGYQKKGGSVVSTYLSMQKPMPLKQKPFGKSVLKKILKRVVENEIVKCPDEVADYKDSFLSNYADTYSMSFDRALDVASSMVNDGSDTALDQIADIANVSGDKQGVFAAVRDVTGYDGVFSNGYGGRGAEGGKIYVAWFPEQIKSVYNRGTWDGNDPRILYQDRAISVSGKEIDVPGGASLKEYQKAAREIYRDLQKTPAYRDDLGQIQFTGAGFGEMKKTGADARKWMLVPKLKEIIERAEYIQRKEADKQRRDRVVAFHWLEADVKLDGTLLRVGVHVAEDASGNKFYNLNQDLVSWAEKYRTPDNHSGQSTPEARELFQDENSSGEKTVSTDGEEVNIHILRSVPQSGTPRASVSFDADGRAVVDFFASADFSSAPHELYHVFRREMEQTAGMADVPARVRENWNRILEFVGAEPGQRWTRDMEEKFARAGERFLLEGKAPTPELHGVFEKMRQWFLELFADADASGLEISDSMRRVFGDMLTTPMEHGDANFRYALGSLLERTFAEDADTRLPEQPDLDKMPLEAVRALADEEMRNLDAHWQQMSQAHPEAAKIIGDDYRAEVLAAEAEEAAAIRNREILDAIVDCELRRGTR